MDAENKAVLETYLNNIKDLYASVEAWLLEKNLSVEEVEHSIDEERFGPYKTNKMIIDLPEKNIRLAELCPVSASVIGADGRVDLTGDYDQMILVYLKPSKPDGTIEKVPYKGVKENGWYWVEDNRRSKAHLIKNDLFFELLEVVSDHEF